MTTLPFEQVDVFTTVPFKGNRHQAAPVFEAVDDCPLNQTLVGTPPKPERLMNRDPGLGNHARPAAEMTPCRAMDNKRMAEKHVASLARRERASSLERGGGKSVSQRRKPHSTLAE